MAEDKKLGDHAIANMINRGLEELQKANIPQAPAEAPSSYQAALDASASRGKTTQRGGMSR